MEIKKKNGKLYLVAKQSELPKKVARKKGISLKEAQSIFEEDSAPELSEDDVKELLKEKGKETAIDESIEEPFEDVETETDLFDFSDEAKGDSLKDDKEVVDRLLDLLDNDDIDAFEEELEKNSNTIRRLNKQLIKTAKSKKKT